MRRDSGTPPWQEVMNRRYVARHHVLPEHARIQVVALIHFERDGWVVLEGLCTRWKGPLAYVRIPDPRIQHGGVWLHASDVRRR